MTFEETARLRVDKDQLNKITAEETAIEKSLIEYKFKVLTAVNEIEEKHNFPDLTPPLNLKVGGGELGTPHHQRVSM